MEVVGKPLATGTVRPSCQGWKTLPNIPHHPLCFVFNPACVFGGAQEMRREVKGDGSLAGHTLLGESHPLGRGHIPVPNPKILSPRLKERVVQKPRCFWCSRNPGGDRVMLLPHPPPSQALPPPRGRSRGGGALFLLHHQLTAAINQPGQALPLTVALQCLAGLKEQEQPPG